MGSSCIHSFADVRSKIERILNGKILIGYKLDDALQGLGLSHPKSDIRDCSPYFSSSSSLSLEEISEKELNRSMESVKAAATNPAPSMASTASTDDMMTISLTADDGISRRPIKICVTTLDLYKEHRKDWEEALIAEARERERKQQNHLNMIARQRQQDQQQQQLAQQQQQRQRYRNSLPTVSLHCDFVRTVLSGRTKTLARVVVVDGPTRNVLMDDFAQISVPVTDFCNTGITVKDVKVVNSSGTNINDGQNINSIVSNSAKPLPILRLQVERLLRGRILVGYKVEDDLKALGLACPWTHVRDTAYFPPFLREKVVGGSRVVTVRSMDELSEEFLRRQLTPTGDRSRSTDLCRTVLYLYETFRVQWERQQEGTYRLQHHQHHQQQQGQMIPAPSPSSVSVSSHRSSHHQQYHYYGQQQEQHYHQEQHHLHQQQLQQSGITSNGVAPMMMSPHLPPRQLKQQQASMTEQQEPGSQSRINSSFWFTWVKQYQHSQAQQNHVATASPMLSPHAFQFLQEDPVDEQLSSQKNSFLQRDNCSSSSYVDSSLYAEETATDSRFDDSLVSDCDSRRGYTENLETFALTSVTSSLRDDSSSVVSSEQASNIVGSTSLRKNGASSSSSSSSSWFRFGSRKSKCSSLNENKNHCESMTAVQESEVLTDDIVMPPPIKLFSSPQEDDDDAMMESQLPPNNEGAQEVSPVAEIPLPSRSWLRFRRSAHSPGRKERSRSPPVKLQSEKNLEDLSIAARPEFSDDAGTEAIEITLSVPSSADSDDSILSVAEKSVQHYRPSTSWFSFRRSLKSTSLKNLNCNTDSLTKNSAIPSLTKGSVPSLAPSATECTAAMDEDWLQEVMSLSTAGGDTVDMSPWIPESGQRDSKANVEKSSSTSRDQSSWFGFKWSKATISNNKASRLVAAVDSEDENGVVEGQNDTAWQNQQHSGTSWLPGASIALEKECLNTIVINNEHNNINDVIRSRARLSTESTIPSVTTEEPSEEPLEEEEYSDSEGYANEFASGAAQSFNFLKI